MNRDVYSVWSILVFLFFYWNQWMTAVRTFKRIRSGKTFFFWRKGSGTILYRGAALWNHCFYKGMVSGHYSVGRYSCRQYHIRSCTEQVWSFCHTAIPDKGYILCNPISGNKWSLEAGQSEIFDIWVNGIIESPLLKRDISTDKIQKPADLFMLVLN